MRKSVTRLLVTVGCVAGVVALAAGAGATTQAVASARDADRLQDYGTRIELDAGSVNVLEIGAETDAGSPTIVLLPGFGTAAPAIDFAPLIDELAGQARVLAYEPLGTGLSDDTDVPRTVTAYSEELHETLTQLGVERPVLMGHSIAGIYALDYTNRYPGEIEAFVGIDSSVPGQPGANEAVLTEGVQTLKALGVLRALNAVADDPYSRAPYTDTQREQTRILTNRNSMDHAMISESAELPGTFAAVADLTFPTDLPVLLFVAHDPELADWQRMHEEQAAAVRRSAVIQLPGEHYLHHTESSRIARETFAFLAN